MPKRIAAICCGVVLFLGTSSYLSQLSQRQPRTRTCPSNNASSHTTAVRGSVERYHPFSFIAYGDTRGRRDGVAVQYEHSLIVDSMLAQMKRLQSSEYPVRFIIQSGDAVVHGQNAKEWNVSFIP